MDTYLIFIIVTFQAWNNCSISKINANRQGKKIGITDRETEIERRREEVVGVEGECRGRGRDTGVGGGHWGGEAVTKW